MRSLPEVLLIDLDDTILRYGVGGEGLWSEIAERFAARMPCSPAEWLAALEAVREPFWRDPERSRAARQDMFAARRAICGEAFVGLGLSADCDLVREVADAYSSEREARIAPFPGALEALIELRRRGHRLGLLTNGGAKLQRAKIERFGIARFFDAMRIEGEVGIGKPLAAAFAGALAALGAAGEPAAMVGDDLDADVAGASAAGLLAFLVDHAGAGPPPAGPRPARVIRSLAELLEPE